MPVPPPPSTTTTLCRESLLLYSCYVLCWAAVGGGALVLVLWSVRFALLSTSESGMHLSALLMRCVLVVCAHFAHVSISISLPYQKTTPKLPCYNVHCDAGMRDERASRSRHAQNTGDTNNTKNLDACAERECIRTNAYPVERSQTGKIPPQKNTTQTEVCSTKDILHNVCFKHVCTILCGARDERIELFAQTCKTINDLDAFLTHSHSTHDSNAKWWLWWRVR